MNSIDTADSVNMEVDNRHLGCTVDYDGRDHENASIDECTEVVVNEFSKVDPMQGRNLILGLS